MRVLCFVVLDVAPHTDGCRTPKTQPDVVAVPVRTPHRFRSLVDMLLTIGTRYHSRKRWDSNPRHLAVLSVSNRTPLASRPRFLAFTSV